MLQKPPSPSTSSVALFTALFIMAKMARSARFEANHDGLSGLLNRAGLLAEIERKLVNTTPVTLYMLDLDGFKAVNDTWGHQIGDALIKRVADAISESHPEITAAARLGGDEFALGGSPRIEFRKRRLLSGL